MHVALVGQEFETSLDFIRVVNYAKQKVLGIMVHLTTFRVLGCRTRA